LKAIEKRGNAKEDEEESQDIFKTANITEEGKNKSKTNANPIISVEGVTMFKKDKTKKNKKKEDKSNRQRGRKKAKTKKPEKKKRQKKKKHGNYYEQEKYKPEQWLIGMEK
jgi:hypothetical protein